MASSPFNKAVLEGKVVLITGGGSGIGFEIALQYGRHGAKLALMGRRKNVLDSAVEMLTADGIEVISVTGDVRNEEDATKAVEQTIARFGKLDILINGAAGNFLVLAKDLTTKGFRTVLDIDTVGTYNMSHAAQPYLKMGTPGKKSGEGGLIINISATLHYSVTWFQVHVSAAKAAIDSMTRSLALEWGTEYGIRVNLIAPGPIADTPGMDKLVPEELGGSKGLKKVGEKWDVAMAAIYLASDAAKFVNGASLVVDGGQWFFKEPHLPIESVHAVSRLVERKSRGTLPRTSKL